MGIFRNVCGAHFPCLCTEKCSSLEISDNKGLSSAALPETIFREQIFERHFVSFLLGISFFFLLSFGLNFRSFSSGTTLLQDEDVEFFHASCFTG